MPTIDGKISKTKKKNALIHLKENLPKLPKKVGAVSALYDSQLSRQDARILVEIIKEETKEIYGLNN